jgi:predicted dithiol-disulfide oxidoreductase (DUF899 family)
MEDRARARVSTLLYGRQLQSRNRPYSIVRRLRWSEWTTARQVRAMERTTMAKYVTGTREEWLAARLKLLKAEKEYSRQGDELTRQRLELPWVLVDKQYRFETDEGSASLKDLYRGRSQLLIYHFMFGSDWTAGCPHWSRSGSRASKNSHRDRNRLASISTR